MTSHFTDARSARPHVAIALLAALATAVFALLPQLPGAAARADDRPAAKAAATTATTYGIWPDSRSPKVRPVKAAKSVSLGLVFSSNTAGRLRGVQYYAAGNRRATTGAVWNAKGRRIASVRFPKASAAGWQTGKLDSSVRIRADKRYTVSYRAPRGRFAKKPGVFDGGRKLSSKGLTAYRGTFTYGKGRPAKTSRGSNYFVDVLFKGSRKKPAPAPAPAPTETTGTTPEPAAGTCVKPDATNTGHTTALTAYSGSTYITTPGTVIEGKNVSGNLTIAADNVTIRNSQVSGTIGVTVGSVGTRVSQATVQGVWVSSAQDVVVTRSDIGYSNNVDSFHLTSDGGQKVQDVTLSHNYIHDPFTSGNHYDGVQLRGADRVTIYCNNFDLGAPQEYYNAAVFLEGGANGGHTGVTVDDNWLFGGAFGFMYGASNDGSTRLTDNHFGGDYRWGPDAACMGVPAVQTGNDLRGAAFTPCRG